MSDFLIDFRERDDRSVSNAVDLMRYFDDINVRVYEDEKFFLVLSRSDDLNIWGPYKAVNGEVFVALCGRVAFDSKEWEEADTIKGDGGLACKIIYQMFKTGGIGSLEALNGNYVVLLFDSINKKFYIISDRCGMFPSFKTNKQNELIYGSHPDILASVLGLSKEWDIVSIAEFLITGKVTFPYSYYKDIKALEYGCIHTIDLRGDIAVYESLRKYFSFNYNIDPLLSEKEIAEELSGAFRKAVNRRTLPIFGQSAISLSGGLDSRIILCSADQKDELLALCFYDEENLEYRIAKSIAEEAGVKIIPFKRDFDHYGYSAEMGVRISGGMGDFGNNHYLGFRKNFQESGISNILTGCYCDYFFKGLPLDRTINKYLNTEKLSEFQYEHYYPFFWFNTSYSNYVKERLDKLYPDKLKNDLTDLGRLLKEEKRLFPLYYEPTNPQRVIPQRVMGWYLPIVDNDVVSTYLKIPPQYKLNISMFSKVVKIQCGKKISSIINANTGARVDASRINLFIKRYKKALERRLRKRRKGIASEDSWPNWEYYIYNSKKIESLWMRKNAIADEIFVQILGKDAYKKTIAEYTKDRLKLLLRLLTLKIWLDQRL